MNPVIHRRASLGLAIHGPFSRNRRRRPLREFTYLALVTAIALAVAAFLHGLFTL